MKGDYNRYLAEFSTGQQQARAIEDAELAYAAAKEKLDKEDFPKINPLRLGVILNTSVFYYEIKNNLDQAIKLANTAFLEANEALNTEDDFDLEDNFYKDITTILQLLKDNLTAWTVEQNEEKEKNKK